MESAALASSIFIVCRVREADKDGYLDDVREELTATIRERLDFFWAHGIRGADFFISAIGPAVSVFGRYGHVYRLDGSEVKVGELLNLVQSLVSEYAMDRIMNGSAAKVGSVDAATRYYILHRWAYAGEKITHSTTPCGWPWPWARMSRPSWSVAASSSRAARPWACWGHKRGKLEDLGLPDRSGRQADIVDVLHRSVALWEGGNREALARFLAEAAAGRDDQVRLVAQTLVDICYTMTASAGLEGIWQAASRCRRCRGRSDCCEGETADCGPPACGGAQVPRTTVRHALLVADGVEAGGLWSACFWGHKDDFGRTNTVRPRLISWLMASRRRTVVRLRLRGIKMIRRTTVRGKGRNTMTTRWRPDFDPSQLYFITTTAANHAAFLRA